MPGHANPDKAVSLAPLDFESALRGLLAVDPESEPLTTEAENDPKQTAATNEKPEDKRSSRSFPGAPSHSHRLCRRP